MKLESLIFEAQILELTQALFEKTEQNNNIVKAWSKKLNMSYDELHKVWDKAKKNVGSETNYAAIVGRFKKMVTSIKGVTKKQLKADGKASFNYKVRTQQTKSELLDDEPAPKKRNIDYVKATKSKINKINQQIKDIKSSPSNTPIRKKRNTEKLTILKSKKKELLNSLK